MDYTKSVNWLCSLKRFGIKPGLKRINRFLRYLGHPERRYESVLVAGTNGKGSTCALVTSILTEAGYKVGFYSSPHILSFRERIRICKSSYISKDYVNDFINNNKHFIESNEITFFEAVTAMALDYFAQVGVDVGVIEVGMGGRFDATNIIRPILSVITSISYDHTQYLGKSLKEIFQNKLGISRSFNKLIISETIKLDSSEFYRQQRNTRFNSDVDLDIIEMKLDCMKISYRGKEIRSKLVGIHQVDNIKTSITVADELKKMGFNIFDSHIIAGIENVFWPGRFQVILRDPIIIVDVAHNPDGLRKVRETLNMLNEFDCGVSIIFGIMADKDVSSCIKEIQSEKDVFIGIKLECERAMDYISLFEIARDQGYKSVYGFDSVSEAIKLGLMTKKPILATGSHYTVEAVLRHLNEMFGIRVIGLEYED